MESKKILELKDITKIYPGVVALDSVSFELRTGEVHILCGENGAGKSTLIKIMSGAETFDSGTIVYEGVERRFNHAKEAQRAGIATIYQEFILIPEMTVAQNIFLGKEPTKRFGTMIDWDKVNLESQALFNDLGVKIDVRQKVKELSVSKQQMVEIAKALSINAKVIIFDEPTSALTSEDANRLFVIIEKLKERGMGIIYISHRIEELFRIGSKVTVLRDGKTVANHDDIKHLTRDKIISQMVGRSITKEYTRSLRDAGKDMVVVKNLTRKGVFENISFHVREGEIVGFSGLVGAGRTEIMRAIYGIDPLESGEIFIDGKQLTSPNPHKAIVNKIAFIPEDRKNEGLCLGLTVRENIILSKLLTKYFKGLINLRQERRFVRKYIKDLAIKTPSQDQIVKNLSGGNQQKAVLAKWLLTDAKIYIFDEPTRGIDVGSKAEFHKLINGLVEEGAAVILISSELPEVLGMSDRIYVMKEGVIVKEFSRDEADQEKILDAAL